MISRKQSEGIKTKQIRKMAMPILLAKRLTKITKKKRKLKG